MSCMSCNLVGLYNKNNNIKNSRNIHHQKSPTLTLNPNPNPNSSFYQVKFENYSINVTPDEYRCCKVKTSL